MMAIPMIPVIMPPVLKLIPFGQRLEKSFAGETALAATFVVSVAMSKDIMEMRVTSGFWNLASRTTGSQIGSPKITTEAEVTATPIKEYSVIVVGRPRVWPRI